MDGFVFFFLKCHIENYVCRKVENIPQNPCTLNKMQIENIPKKELGGPTIENEHHNRKPSSKTVKRSLDLETDKTGYKKPVAISFTTVKTGDFSSNTAGSRENL